ncbi:MAG: hypothetical protein WBG19_09680 [Thermoplasmata archaeon]
MRKSLWSLLGVLALGGLAYAQQPVNTSTFQGLPHANTITGNEIIPLDQNGVTKSATSSQLTLGSMVLGVASGGTGLFTVGPNGTCLQSTGSSLTYGACGSGGSGGNPVGPNGAIQYNNSGVFGPYSIGSGLVVTTSGGVSFLNSTSTGGVAPAGADGAIQYNAAGSFGGYGVGTGLFVSGGNLNSTGAPGGASGTIQYNNSGVFGGLTLGSGLYISGGALAATVTGAAPPGLPGDVVINGGGGFLGALANTSTTLGTTQLAQAAAVHNTIMNGLSYDPRDPAYGAICGGWNVFTADGVTTAFNYTIPFTGSSPTDNSGFFVFYELSNGGGSATILNGSQFSVTGVNSGSGGTITLNSAPAAGNIIFVVHDDGPGIVSAATAAVASGGYTSVPDGCTIYTSQTNGTQLPDKTNLIGQNFIPSYAYNSGSSNPRDLPMLYVIAPTGAAPNFGINVSGKCNQFFEGFEITSNVPGHDNVGYYGVPVLIGSNGSSGAGCGQLPGITAQYMTFNYGSVGFGAPHGGNSKYIFATLRFNNFIGNKSGAYGPFSDTQFYGNDFASNGSFGSVGDDAGLTFVQQNAPGPPGAGRVEHNRFEYNIEGVNVENGQLITFVGNEFDGNSYCGLDLGSFWDQIGFTGNWMRGNGNGGGNFAGTLSPGHDAHICFNSGSGSTGFNAANNIFVTNASENGQVPIGTNGATTPAYALDFNSPAANNTGIVINGGNGRLTKDIDGASVADFAIYRQGKPSDIEINLTGQSPQGNLVNGQNASQIRGIPPGTWTIYNAYGDQVTSYGFVLSSTQYYPYLINQNLNGSLNYYTDPFGFDCDIVNTEIFPNANPSTTGNPLTTWLPSVVDPAYGNYSDPAFTNHRNDTHLCRMAGLTWLGIPSAYKVAAQSGTTTGSWGNFASYGGALGLTSTTQGSSLALTITTYGGPIYLGYELQAVTTGVASGGQFTYNLDGALSTTATVNSAGSGAWTYACGGLCPNSQAPAAIRIPVRTTGSHTINIALTSSTTTGNPVTINYLATPPGKAYLGGGPTVFYGGQLFQQNDANSAYTAAYNSDEMTDANQLFTDGAPINFVNIRNYVNDLGDTTSNYQYITGTGEQHIADAMQGLIQEQTGAHGTIIDPRSFGAECNTQYLDGRNYSGGSTGIIGSTTTGSNIIAVNGYNFVNAADPAGDIGKTLTPFNPIYFGGDVGGTTTILGVTATGQAIVGENMAVTSSYVQTQFGHNDTAAFQAAMSAANTLGLSVLVPNNCLVAGLTVSGTPGVSLGGSSWADGYGYGNDTYPIMYIASNGYSEDPLYGIDIGGAFQIGFHGFEIKGNTEPYTGNFGGGGTQMTCPPPGPINYGGACTPQLHMALMGTSGGTSNSFDAVSLDHMTFTHGPVGFGAALGGTTTHVGEIFGGSVHSSFSNNGIGFYTPGLSDWHSLDDDMEYDYSATIYLGPLIASYAPTSSRFTNLRVEDSPNPGLVCDGCQQMEFDNVQFQYDSPNDVVLSNASDISFSSGFMQVGMYGVGTGIAANISGSKNIVFDDVSFFNDGYALGATITGATQSSNIEIRGGILSGGSGNNNGTLPANWGSVAPPTNFIVDVIDYPYLRTGDTSFTVNAAGQFGLGTTTPTPGTGLDMLSDTTTYNSSIGLPNGSTTARPAAPVNGMMRYNTSLSQYEAYANGNWNPVGSLAGYIGGLNILNDTTTPNAIIDVTPGAAASDDNLTILSLPYQWSKTTGSFATGWGNGCLDSGSVTSNTFYNVYAVGGGGSPVDILCSTSAITPAVPAGFTKKRRLNCGFKTDASSHILSLTEDGNSCWWGTPTLDVNTALSDTSTHFETLNVPAGVKVQPICSYSIGGTGNAVLMYSPDTSPAGSTTTSPFTASPGYSFLASSTTGGPANSSCPLVTTNTSGQVGLEMALSTTTTVGIITQGWREIPQPSSISTPVFDGLYSLSQTTTTATINFTSQSGNDGIFVFSYADVNNGGGSFGTNSIASISDSNSLTWTRRRGPGNVEEWYSTSPSPLTNDAISINYTLLPGHNQIYAVGVAGLNTTSLFDTSTSLPAFNQHGYGNVMSTTTTGSTSQAHDMIFGWYIASTGFRNTSNIATPPTGFISLFPTSYLPGISYESPPYLNLSYELSNNAMTSKGFTWTNSFTGNGNTGQMIDAVRANGN